MIKLFVFFNFILRGCNLQDVTSIVLVYHISNPKQERDWPISLNSQSHLFCRLSLCLQKRLERAKPVSYLFDPGRGKNGAVRWLVFFLQSALQDCIDRMSSAVALQYLQWEESLIQNPSLLLKAGFFF